MTDNNFQEGVGQKIVEALKQQDEGVQTEATVEEAPSFAPQTNTFSYEPQNSREISQDIYSNAFKPQESYNSSFDAQTDPFETENDAFGASSYGDMSFQAQNQNVQQAQPAGHMPPNVAVLRRLISQLPNGVTKQTGAQIIRQTMEALGISMNNVLHEAQQVQDGLNDSVKTCMYSIQEYKNNIKSLEKQVLDYQKQIAYLNDLISLFVMTDKTR